MQQQQTHLPTEVTMKDVKRLNVVARKNSNKAFADMVSCESSEPFQRRLMDEYIRQFGHMSSAVMTMIGVHSLAYNKVKGRCEGAKAFSPYAEYVRDVLYLGDKKFLQMGKRESELMFIGAMIMILAPEDSERGLFIQLWNKRHQQKFWLKESGAM